MMTKRLGETIDVFFPLILKLNDDDFFFGSSRFSNTRI